MKEYFEAVEFPELEKHVEQNVEEQPKPKILASTLDTCKVEILRIVRAIETGESSICAARQASAKLPFWNALDLFFNHPTKETLENFLKICEQDFTRRFRAEVANVLLQFEDLQNFIKKHRINLL